MLFNEVIGQAGVKTQLIGMARQGRLSHALLFLGPEGAGGLPLTLALAQYLVCERAGPQDSCGECPSCLRATQLAHPDIHYTYPVIPKKSGDKPVSTDYIREWRDFVRQTPYGNVYDWLQSLGAENKQGNITAQECSDIGRQLSLKAFEGGWKILVLWMPEYLGNEGNKLLKLIEEPPAKTFFFLVAENEAQVLPTILSRTQLIRVPPLSINDIEAALLNRGGVSPEGARQAAALGEGSFREALQELQHTDEDLQALLRDWLNAMLKGGPAAQVRWVDGISKLGREKQKLFLRYFSHLLETAVRLRFMEGEALAVPEAEQDFALRLNKISSVEQQEAMVRLLDQATYHVERNANGKMLFMALTVKLYHVIADKSLILAN